MMKALGEFLGTRALGARVRESIRAKIRASTGPVIVDFSEVQGITQSFADEAFRKLIVEIGPAEASRIVIRGGSDDVRAVLRYATSRRDAPEDPSSTKGESGDGLKTAGK